MKKFVLTLIALFFVGSIFAQQQQQPRVINQKDAKNLWVSVPLHPETTQANYAPVNNRSAILPYHTIGQTYYDLQTNGALPQRIVTFPDGTVSATWTTCGTNSSSRGAGYNHLQTNGYWSQGSGSSAPTARIETARGGWPTIGTLGDNGEIVVSHNGSTGLMVNVRPNKGTGDWTQTLLQGPTVWDSTYQMNSTALLWPSLATSGNTIHLIACTESDAGSYYQGVQTCLVYYRGTYNPSDNTIAWEQPRIVGDMDQHLDWFNTFSGDNYVIAANGNTVAIVYAETWADAFLWKSTDGGNTFTTSTIVNSFIPDNFNEAVHFIDTAGGPCYVVDGATALAVDNNGKVHCAFGLTGVANPELGDGYITLYYGAQGLLYWNEDMPAFLSGAREQLDPDSLVNHGYIVFDRVDLDGDGSVWVFTESESDDPYSFNSYKRSGPISMPSLAVDGNNVYLVYQALLDLPFYAATGQYYRGVFGVKSTNGGTSFEEGVSWLSYNEDCYYVDWNLYDWSANGGEWTVESVVNEGENVYPSVSRNIVNGKLNMIWHNDYFPGTNNGNIATDPTNVIFTSIDANQLGLYNNTEEIPQGLWLDGVVDNTLSSMKLYPNPATDNVNILIASKENANAHLTIFNLMGQQVYSEDVAVVEGNNLVRVSTSNLQAGVYMVNIKTNSGTSTQKLIVK